MKNPNNPYNINKLPTMISRKPTSTLEEVIEWYLEQIYQIELELKGQLNKEYQHYLEIKHDFLVSGIFCIILWAET